MEQLEKELLRKVEIRLMGRKTLGLDEDELLKIECSEDKIDDEAWGSFELLNQNLLSIDETKFFNKYRPISENGKMFGKCKRFIKRVIRKIIYLCFGWYIFPEIDRQNIYNGKNVNAVSIQRDILYQQEKRIENLEKSNKKLIELYLSQKAAIEKQQENRIKFFNQECETMLQKTSKQYEHILESFNTEKLANTKRYYQLKEDIQDVQTYVEQEKEKIRFRNRLKDIAAIDYFDFENKFRGSQEVIKNNQKQYLSYFKQLSNAYVLDIGCGRGEFLELLSENQVPCKGIDRYTPFVNYCIAHNLNVIKADALEYLESVEDNSIGGIFMSQIVEHLEADYIVAIIRVAYKKLIKDAFIIIETPNPEVMATYLNFNIDLDHIKPIHFLTLKYFLEDAKYTNITKLEVEASRYPINLKSIQIDKNFDLEQMKKLDNILFGCRDYAVMAQK